jgi:hypothetical protein
VKVAGLYVGAESAAGGLSVRLSPLARIASLKVTVMGAVVLTTVAPFAGTVETTARGASSLVNVHE